MCVRGHVFAEDRAKQTGAVPLGSLHSMRSIRHLGLNYLLRSLVSSFEKYSVLTRFAKMKGVPWAQQPSNPSPYEN